MTDDVLPLLDVVLKCGPGDFLGKLGVMHSVMVFLLSMGVRWLQRSMARRRMTS